MNRFNPIIRHKSPRQKPQALIKFRYCLHGLILRRFEGDNIIRPLISSSREDIEAYCRENGLSFVTDSTNLSREYTRNKLRLDVIPVLREINPSLEKSLYDFSNRLRNVNEYIKSEAGQLLIKAKEEDGDEGIFIKSETGYKYAKGLEAPRN